MNEGTAVEGSDIIRSGMNSQVNLQEWFGGIDIYLFDQLLKGRFTPPMRVLDAGCGGGRNLSLLLAVRIRGLRR